MQALSHVIQQMIQTSPEELEHFISMADTRTYSRKEFLVEMNKVCNEVFFINKGMLRVLIVDLKGTEHTVHFAMENQFISEYSSFLQQIPANYALQALEKTEVVVMPRVAVEWGYNHMKEGQKLGRLIAEYYFIYLDNRINNQYTLTAKERYDHITQIFPDIHNRAPQHMIASYLGISSVHLSRLKREG